MFLCSTRSRFGLHAPFNVLRIDRSRCFLRDLLVYMKNRISKLRQKFENRAYDSRGDYWWNVFHLLVFGICLLLGLLVLIFG